MQNQKNSTQGNILSVGTVVLPQHINIKYGIMFLMNLF